MDVRPGHYGLHASGVVTAELAEHLANTEDAFRADAALLGGEDGKRVVYALDRQPYKTDNTEGGTVVLIGVGPAHASADGEPVAPHVGLYVQEGIDPGEYGLEKGSIEVRPGALPVTPVAGMVSPEGECKRQDPSRWLKSPFVPGACKEPQP